MTAQKSEILIYQARGLSMATTPLEAYFEKTGTKSPFSSFSTNLWRGYVGKWEIDDDKLYLVELLDVHFAKTEAGFQWDLEPHRIGLTNIFTKSDGRVLADWFTGQLRCPQGQLRTYIPMGFSVVSRKWWKFSGGVLRAF